MLPDNFQILSPSEVDWTTEIEETGESLEENAFLKANTLYQHCGLPVLADDSGLLVDALGGHPGVRSARYAGENASDGQNMDKLLLELKGISDRQARFKTVLAWIEDGKASYFLGEVIGKIAEEVRGSNGFGYDPLFIPEGHEKTFGELPPEIKKQLSHRSNALKAFLQFLKTKD